MILNVIRLAEMPQGVRVERKEAEDSLGLFM